MRLIGSGRPAADAGKIAVNWGYIGTGGKAQSGRGGANATDSAKRSRPRAALTSMRENVVFAEAGEIELGARVEEPERSLRERLSALTRQHGVELGLEGVEMQHVGRRIGELLLG